MTKSKTVDSARLKCSCGSLRGVADGLSTSGAKRIVCLCADCQAYAHFLGRAKDVLDENGGTDVFPVTPRHLKITSGIENLKCLRLTPKGLFRWYAGCCKTPIANTLSPKMPFAGTVHSIMDHAADGMTREEALGPIDARVLGKSAIGKVPPGTSNSASVAVILRTIRFLLRARLKGEHTPSPFYDSSGAPKAKPYVLSEQEREGLRKFCGPKPQLSG
jgi:hypothetical protein